MCFMMSGSTIPGFIKTCNVSFCPFKSNLTAPNSMILFFNGSIPVVSRSRDTNMLMSLVG